MIPRIMHINGNTIYPTETLLNAETNNLRLTNPMLLRFNEDRAMFEPTPGTDHILITATERQEMERIAHEAWTFRTQAALERINTPITENTPLIDIIRNRTEE